MKQFENGQEVSILVDDNWEVAWYVGKYPLIKAGTYSFTDIHVVVQPRTKGYVSVFDADIKAAPILREGWINIYPNNKTSQIVYATEERAVTSAASDRITTIKIEWAE